jgi:hypothetical protein
MLKQFSMTLENSETWPPADQLVAMTAPGPLAN